MFGQTVADANANQEAWIKGFKDGETRIRICQEVPTWIKYLQHFSDEAFYFPCKKTADCVGCLYPQELDDQGRPKMSAQYAFNAMDEKGNLNIYRLGTKAFKILQSRYQRIGTVMDRDYVIVRSGKGFDTTYVPEPGERFDATIPEQLIDIQNALALKYEEARAATMAAKEKEALEAQEAANNASVPEVKVQEAAPLKTVTDEDRKAAEKAIEDSLGGSQFDDMGTPEIKQFLTDRKVEIPPRAGRAALIKIAEESKDLAPF